LIHDFVWPAKLSEGERVDALKILRAFPDDAAQELLDELSGRMRTVRLSPVSLLAGMARNARANLFFPTVAAMVREAREKAAKPLERDARQKLTEGTDRRTRDPERVKRHLAECAKALGIRRPKSTADDESLPPEGVM
jgi:hypothetical protein